MTASTPTILALDFDGVICNGLIEYFDVAWLTYCQIWSQDNQTPPDDLASKFYQLRPVIETGWEMPILIKALVEGIAEEKIFQEWESIAQEFLTKDNLKAAELSTGLDRVRDEWITRDLDGWLGLHRFYPGIIDKIKATIVSTVKLYINIIFIYSNIHLLCLLHLWRFLRRLQRQRQLYSLLHCSRRHVNPILCPLPLLL